MVSVRILKELGCTTIEGYFSEIVESKKEGNFSDVRELIAKLGKDQKKAFIVWFDGMSSDKDMDYCKREALKQL